ncbi:MAG TPA: glutamine--fructose-6-phosphate transaminase (isomerizing) [Candidatus Thermoplasmatota archaeon]|nr:glutamine--fructose-6-phosphate transaminase (isomerizing) [Candidatus Thermoplasmatota archaeon]
MCGIIGVVGTPDAAKTILDGLRRLEYRGYDSAGLAVLTDSGLTIERAAGPVAHLAARPAPQGHTGVGHTRWATHGAPTELNAHPHKDCSGRLALAHNGIIENFLELREKLVANGHAFTSETDTEVIAHLVEQHLEGDLLKAVRSAIQHLEGSYAIVVVSADSPDRIVAARHKSPLLVGMSDKGAILASDATAILAHTNKVVFLDDGDVVELEHDRIHLYDRNGEAKIPIVRELDWTPEAAEKGGFEHFMLKEIHEIPDALHELFRGRLASVGSRFDVEGRLTEDHLRSTQRVMVLACGTSHYAGMVGKSIVEQLAGVPVEVHLASEFRYAPSIHPENTLAILVSQSGETADTLEALRRAQQLGCKTLALVNVVGSSLAREADGVFYLRAGPEIGVASTKAFVNMLGSFYLLGLHLAKQRGRITPDETKRYLADLRGLPRLAQQTLEKAEELRTLGGTFFSAFDNAFYLGRQANYGLAMEGALKLKEISYVHAEGYAAGELKHGPLALLEGGFPVVALLPERDPTYGVMTSNLGEVRARGAKVLAIASAGDAKADKHAEKVFRVPSCDPLFFPVPASVALYLLAYYAARARGCNIDKPRNLAKSVTVE